MRRAIRDGSNIRSIGRVTNNEGTPSGNNRCRISSIQRGVRKRNSAASANASIQMRAVFQSGKGVLSYFPILG